MEQVAMQEHGGNVRYCPASNRLADEYGRRAEFHVKVPVTVDNIRLDIINETICQDQKQGHDPGKRNSGSFLYRSTGALSHLKTGAAGL
ncbi:MAG: hypothetical protein MZV70_21560 [Desulfobacterales bacterium]|nr:hypothetical protein [Desulfobacterales bacterium]